MVDTFVEEEEFIDLSPLDSKDNPADNHLDAEFGSLDDFKTFTPELDVLYIPELKKNYHIRYLTGLEVDAYRQSLMIGKGANQTINQRGMRAKLVALSLANPDGSRMLTDKDIPDIQRWKSSILERIFDRSRKLNGLTDADTDDEKGN